METKVDFGGWIQQGFDLYKENIGTLILAALLAILISAITGGILAGPMFCGLILMVLRLHDKSSPKPEVGDVFKGFEYFLNSFLFLLVWSVIAFVALFILAIIPCLGQILSLMLVFCISALLMFGLYLIADRKMDFWPASMESINKVKQDFWPLLGLSVVASLIGAAGGIACGIGMVVTAPLQFCIIAVAYRKLFTAS